MQRRGVCDAGWETPAGCAPHSDCECSAQKCAAGCATCLPTNRSQATTLNQDCADLFAMLQEDEVDLAILVAN